MATAAALDSLLHRFVVACRSVAGWPLLLAAALTLGAPLMAANLTASPGDDLQAKINSMNAGDTLTLTAGNYTVNFLNVNKTGTASNWYTIQAAAGATVVLTNPGGQNMFNFDNSHYVKIIGLEIRNSGTTSGDAFKWTGSNSDFLIENCYIHNIGGVGISCSSISGHFYRLTVRRCTITATGQSSGATGEGMYLGKNDGSAAIMNSVFENNWVHHTGGSQGDGIELNQNGHGNIFRDNVVHNTAYPCILIENSNAGTNNIVERNVLWNSANETLQVNGYAIVRNNIVQNGGTYAVHVSGTGIEMYNNTIYDTSAAIYFGGNLTLKFANNIVDGAVGNTPNGTVTNNYWKSASFGASNVTATPGYNAGSMNFYPTNSAYINAGWNGDGDVPADDFNTTPRTGLPDIGAYEITGPTNPGWTITASLKVNTPANQPPTIASPAAATPNPVVNAATTSLSVSASDPDSGPSALTYTWSKVSGPGTVSFSPNGTTGSNLSTATFGASGTYSIRVTVSDGATSVTSTISSLTVTLPVAGTAPSITTQPANKAVTAGQTATFSVAASGSATLTYQWQKNSSNIGGATGSSYTTPATAIGDNGNTYRVIVTNGYGSVTSNQATLSVSFGVNPLTPTVTSISLPAAPGSTTPVSTTFQLTNSSGATVTVTITDGQSWLTATPGSVSIPAGATVTFTVTGNPTGLSGVVSGSLTLTNAPGGQTQTIPVALDLSGTLPAASTGGKKSGCAVSTPGAPNGFALALLAMSALGLLPALLRRRTA